MTETGQATPLISDGYDAPYEPAYTAAEQPGPDDGWPSPPGRYGNPVKFLQWIKALWADTSIPLAERAIAMIIAEHGANGIGCFATAATVARIAGYERKYVERARASLIRRGWFTVVSRTGGHYRRSLVLSIAAQPARCQCWNCSAGNGDECLYPREPATETSPAGQPGSGAGP